jgi:hypothetical protein
LIQCLPPRPVMVSCRMMPFLNLSCILYLMKRGAHVLVLGHNLEHLILCVLSFWAPRMFLTYWLLAHCKAIVGLSCVSYDHSFKVSHSHAWCIPWCNMYMCWNSGKHTLWLLPVLPSAALLCLAMSALFLSLEAQENVTK